MRTNMVIGTLYIILPLVWFVMMSWAGFQAGNAISAMFMPMSASADASGSAGGALTSAAVKGAIGGMK